MFVISVLVVIVAVIIASVVLVQLPGAVLAFEFMAFAGNATERHGHNHQGKKFHRGAS